MPLFAIKFFDDMVDPQALPVAFAGDAGNVFGVNADSFHLLYCMYALSMLHPGWIQTETVIALTNDCITQVVFNL